MRLAFAGGGTGGHIAPGRRVLEALDERLVDLVWFTSGRAVEDRALAGLEETLGDAPWERVKGELEPPGGGAPGIARIGLRLLPEVLNARRALKRHGSEVMLGLGGFSALAPVLAARSLGIPCAWLEVNTVSGRATRALAPLCSRIWHAWDATSRGREADVVVGPPLEPRLFAGTDEEGVRAAREALGFDPERPLLVVLGGSQGALGLNRFIAAHASALVGGGLSVLHQCGPGRTGEGAGELEGYRAVEFVDDVPTLLSAAALALARAGASTVAELGAARVPAVFVPHPASPDRHQHHNAELLGSGAKIVDESDLNSACVLELIRLAGPEGADDRAQMREVLGGKVPRDGAERVAQGLLRLLGIS